MASLDRRQAVLGAIAATLAGLTSAAVAQPMMGPGSGRGPGMMGGGLGGGPGMMGGGPGMMGSFADTESYLASLKLELGIKANQEAAWKAYVDTVVGVRTQMQGLHQTMFDAMGTASWEERRDMMNRMFQARQQAFDTVHDAANKLMPVLSAAQQTKARRSLPGLGFGPGMMGPRGRGGGQR